VSFVQHYQQSGIIEEGCQKPAFIDTVKTEMLGKK